MIGMAILDLTFTSQQGTQVTLRRVECLVSRDELSDNVILIGRRELDILGINPDDIFEDKYSNSTDSVELATSTNRKLTRPLITWWIAPLRKDYHLNTRMSYVVSCMIIMMYGELNWIEYRQ
ncbi:unnamed protein product (mitochondrion) [Plasmodiophora brassicae]|uniref:Uncharacterized protein n=1 Tax=Plasmodiophora brassicae TaxID=37360 RepID=A0A3P3YKZ6_PLABS|nr:unnamed protein product [Plasmodiophora brassicae]